MIDRLSRRFVWVTTCLLSVLLLIILSIICLSTWTHMENDMDAALQAASAAQQPSVIPQPGTSSYTPCFILRMDSQGELEVFGHAYFDLSDQQQLKQILLEAQATGQERGNLKNRNLRFLCRSFSGREEYVFVDITDQLHDLKLLRLICCSVFAAALGIFFVISHLLARWMVRPVENAWDKQRQFVADASHELKTPLTVILTNAEMLQSGEYDSAANQRFTNGIVTMAHQMRGLTEGLLELAKTDSAPIAPNLSSTVDLSQLAENSVLHFEPVYYEAGRALEGTIQPGIHVRGNSGNLQQVVEILLDNGQKYSTPGSTVSLKLEQNRSHCTLRIRSQGQSMTSQQCRDIFQRFYRLDEARTRSRSYGLGLPIAQALVHQHRGKIWLQSKDGVNTFFVTLPTYHPEK